MPRRADLGRSPLALALAVVFVAALVFGAGPGLRLVDPGPDHVGPAPTVLGLPIVYAWGIAWFIVEALVIVVAYCFLWDCAEEAG